MPEELLLIFINTHATMAAADLLTEQGVAHRVVPKPLKLAAECGIAILVGGDDFVPAMAALSTANTPPRAIYRPAAEGLGEWVPWDQTSSESKGSFDDRDT